MGELLDLLSGIFDTHLWPPRWQCGTWTDFHGWLFIGSDVAIWGAYFAIPLLVVNIVSKKRVPFLPVFWLAAGFILFCGFTHLVDAIIFYYPVYHFAAIMRLGTAIISWATVYVLYKNLPRVFSLKTPEELEVEVKNRKKAENVLAHRNVELEQTNRELDRLVYSASHDLRAPLTSISGALQYAKENTTDNKLIEIFALMERNLNNLDGIIYDISCFSGNKRQEVVKSEVDAEYLYTKAVSAIPAEHQNDSIQLLFKDNVGDKMWVDEDRMVQVLRILLDNGITYRDESKSPVWVKITFSEEAGKYILTVQDNGVGIHESEGDKIFNMFYRGHSKSQGSGLGLYLLKEIVKKLDGKVKYKSVVSEGSTFTVEIPK
ncbi:MAG: sensor histidine kinase [Luteibaculum sp.]